MRSLVSLILSAMCVMAVGCTSGGSSPSLPSNQLYAQTYEAGVLSPWANAHFYALGVADNNCSLASDSNCITQVNSQFGNNGYYTLSTDAIPGTWDIGVSADSNCSGGASFSGPLSSGGSTTLSCGAFAPGVPALSPDTCTQTTYIYDKTGQRTTSSNCPSTVTLTMGAATFPTTRAMSVTGYNDAAQQIQTTSVYATSSTQMTMATPQTVGSSVLVIRDPNSGSVLGTGLFTYNVVTHECTQQGGRNCS